MKRSRKVERERTTNLPLLPPDEFIQVQRSKREDITECITTMVVILVAENHNITL